MKTAPLQLIKYLIPDVSCSANRVFDANKEYEFREDLFGVDVSVTPTGTSEEGEEQDHCWSIEMTLSKKIADQQNFPYSFSATIVGYFICGAVPANLTEERLVRVNGASVLYGVAREVIRHLTSPGPWGELMIPTLSFYEPAATAKGEPQQVAASE